MVIPPERGVGLLCGDEPVDRGDERRFVERLENFAGRTHPFVDLDGPAQGDQRLGLLDGKGIDVGSNLPLQHKQVAEPARGNQRRPAPLALKHGIGRDGRTVDELRERFRRSRERFVEPVHNTD